MLDLSLEVLSGNFNSLSIHIAHNEEYTSSFPYNKSDESIEFNRTYSGMIRDAVCQRKMKLENPQDALKLRLILDKFSAELFVNDRAVTIEVASDTFAPYKVTDKAYKSLITLLADICIRNNIKELKWKADKSLIGQVDKQNMTVHRWFHPGKSCPGDYLYNLHGQIAKEVNERINCGFKIGKKVRFTKNKNIYKSDCKTRVNYSSLNKNWKAKSHKGITGKAVFDKGETAILKAIEHKNGKVFGVFGGKNYRILLVDKKGKKTGKQ